MKKRTNTTSKRYKREKKNIQIILTIVNKQA